MLAFRRRIIVGASSKTMNRGLLHEEERLKPTEVSL